MITIKTQRKNIWLCRGIRSQRPRHTRIEAGKEVHLHKHLTPSVATKVRAAHKIIGEELEAFLLDVYTRGGDTMPKKKLPVKQKKVKKQAPPKV